tara:strand:- start:423 stop:551 length:129 start_codon:yes stop_codon:yes gene_type:complete
MYETRLNKKIIRGMAVFIAQKNNLKIIKKSIVIDEIMIIIMV